jgi:hypothetical protein
MPRGLNIPAIRSRVEKLANLLPQRKPTLIIKFEQTDGDCCPACGYDIEAHVLAAAHEEAKTSDRAMIWCDSWEWPTCPQCGGPNPNASGNATQQPRA